MRSASARGAAAAASLLLPLALAATTPVIAAVPAHAPAIRHGTLCGWFANPTPQNFSLLTASADWLIGEQGGFQAAGDWDAPSFRRGQWVHTNGGSYGYGCACLRGSLDETIHHVLKVERISARSLTTCRRDPALRARETAAR